VRQPFKSICYLFFAVFLTGYHSFGQGSAPAELNGLFFSGNHKVPASPYRTNPGYKLPTKTLLNLTHSRLIDLTGNYSISFRVSFWSDFSHGNIFRVENSKYTLKFNFNHHPDSSDVFLTLSFNGEATSVVFPIKRVDLYDGKWYDMSFVIDEHKGIITGTVNGQTKTFTTNPFFRDKKSLVAFGADGPTFDCAPMILQDLRLTIGGKLAHHWLFNEMEGNTAYDSEGDLDARVTDHDWLINRHFTPAEKDSFFIRSPGPVKLSFDKERKLLMIHLPGEMKIYDLTYRRIRTISFMTSEAEGNLTGTSIWDSLTFEFEDTENSLKYMLHQYPKKDGVLIRIFTQRLPILTKERYDELLENSPTRVRQRAGLIYLWMAIGAGVLVLITAGYFGKKYFTRRRGSTPLSECVKDENGVIRVFPETGYISIFGKLKLIDKSGVNHADNLPPMLRELLAIIIFYSKKQPDGTISGVNLKMLEDVFWYNIKSENLKNNRNVAFANIRKAIKGFEGMTLQVKDNEVALIYPGDNSNRVAEFFNILEYLETAQPNPNEDAFALFAGIVSEGMALTGLHSEWADNTRSVLRSKTIGILEKYMTILQKRADHKACIKVANIAFMHDPLHEVTLKLILNSLVALGDTSRAEDFYRIFCERYYNALKEEFPFEFDELMEG